MRCTSSPTVNTNYGSKESDSSLENLTDHGSAEKPRNSRLSPRHSLHQFVKEVRSQSQQASSASITDLVQRMWQRLTVSKAPEPAEFHNAIDVGCNDSGVKCLKNSCVEVERSQGTVVLHANRLDIASAEKDNARTLAKTSYVVGQSPVSENRCESFLVNAMKSGNGVYQFVSERTHRRIIDGKKSFAESAQKERSIVEEIQTKLAFKQSQPSKCVIDGKYEIVALREVGADSRNSNGNASQATTHSHFLLEFRDQANGSLKTIPITQAGFAFKDKVLREEQLREANACLATHIGLRNNSDANSDIAETVLSYAGIGRNAALIVFSEASKIIEANHITTEPELDTALENLINQGRAVRGPHFLHSEAQLQEIRNACLASLNARNNFVYPSDDAFLSFSDSDSDSNLDDSASDLDLNFHDCQENFEDDVLPVQHPPLAQTAIYLEPGRNPDHLNDANETAREEEALDDMAPLTEPLAPFRPAENVTSPILESNASPKMSSGDAVNQSELPTDSQVLPTARQGFGLVRPARTEARINGSRSNAIKNGLQRLSQLTQSASSVSRLNTANTASLDSSLPSNALQLDLPGPFSEMSDRLKIDILLQAAHKLEEKNRSGLMVRLQTTANQDETNLCFPVVQIESRRLSVEGCRKFALEIALQSHDNHSEIPAIADAFLASVPEEQTEFVILGVVLGRERLMQWQIGEGLPGQINDSDSLHELDKVLYSIDSQSAHDPAVINEGIKRLNRIKENISPGALLTLDETENGIRQYLENRHSPEVALRGLEIVMQREGLGAFEEDISLPTELGCSVATEMAIIWSYIQDVDDQDLKDNLLESMTEKFCEIVAERPCGTGVSQRLIDIPTAIDWSITEDVSVKDIRQQLTRIAAKIDEEFNDKAQSDVKPLSIENVSSPSDNCIDHKLLHDKLPDSLEKELKRDLFKQRATVELLVLEGRQSETVSAEINSFSVKNF